jgi:intracellular septation protein A
MVENHPQIDKPTARWRVWVGWGIFLILVGAGNIYHGSHTLDFPNVTWVNYLAVGIPDIVCGVVQIIIGIVLAAIGVRKRRSIAG